MMHRNGWFIPLVVLLAGCQNQAMPAAGPLEGAWKLVGLVDIGPDGATTQFAPQESLLLFAGGFYSMAYAQGEDPSPDYVDWYNPTDEETLARMNSITVNTGTFEIQGSNVTMHPLFARVPAFTNGLAEHEFELSGDTLILNWFRTVTRDGTEDTGGIRTLLTLVRLP